MSIEMTPIEVVKVKANLFISSNELELALKDYGQGQGQIEVKSNYNEN